MNLQAQAEAILGNLVGEDGIKTDNEVSINTRSFAIATAIVVMGIIMVMAAKKMIR